MRVELTRDESYPISISDTYSETYIDRFTVWDETDWNEFIQELNQRRSEYLRKRMAKKK